MGWKCDTCADTGEVRLPPGELLSDHMKTLGFAAFPCPRCFPDAHREYKVLEEQARDKLKSIGHNPHEPTLAAKAQYERLRPLRMELTRPPPEPLWRRVLHFLG